MFTGRAFRAFSVLSAIFAVVLLYISINGPATFPDQSALTWVDGQPSGSYAASMVSRFSSTVTRLTSSTQTREAT